VGWLIAYDIAEDRRWRRVYARVRRDAARLQYSLFYGELTPREVDALAADLARLIDPAADDVRLYHLPDDAWVRFRGRRPAPEGVCDGALSRLLARSEGG
jgi:CRISPR-associated protein Cas2